jgi:myosin heavy subunit
MAEEQASGGDPQASDPKSGDGQELQDTFDRPYVEKLRNEAAKYRTQLRDLESKVEQFGDYDQLKEAASKWQELEDKNKSEMEKLQEKLGKLESERDQALQRAQETMIRSAFDREATKLGFAHPEDVYALADKSQVEISDEGQVKGVEKAVKALEGRLPMSKPKAPSVDGGAGGNAQGSKSGFTEADIREMAAIYNVDPKLMGEQYGIKIED